MIYFDNAATSFPKPPQVLRTVNDCLRNYCGNPGRGSHFLSRKSAEVVYSAREEAASFFGLSGAENVVFTYNDTYALNFAIKGVLRRGDHVIISDMEHNSIYRPVYRMAHENMITYNIFDSLCLENPRTPDMICKSIEKLIRPRTRLIAVTHVSNICSAALPLEEIGKLCRKYKITFLVDAAQSAGHLPIDMEKMNIDLLCAPAHKGLLGIQGCGLLLMRNGTGLSPLIEGGSGVNSLAPEMPELPPERYEAGTISVPAIAALGEGIRYINSVGLDAIHEKEKKLFCKAADMLSDIRGVTVYAPNHLGSTLLFNVNGSTPEQTSERLDRAGICVRGGFHCSPLGHKALRTGENGAVRASFGLFNTEKEVTEFCRVLKEIASEGS